MFHAQAFAQSGAIYNSANVGNATGKIFSDPAKGSRKGTVLSFNESGTQCLEEAGDTACEDLITDSICETEEGGNTNLSCDSPNRQGKLVTGAFEVYDGNDLFIGYLVSINGQKLTVFNAEIPGYFSVQTKASPRLELTNLGELDFQSTNCTGQPTIFFDYGHSLIFYDQHGDKYYLSDTSVVPFKCTMYSSRKLDTDQCQKVTLSGDCITLKELTTFPFREVTLAYPITVRHSE
jgi:hypothetical protein